MIGYHVLWMAAKKNLLSDCIGHMCDHTHLSRRQNTLVYMLTDVI